MKTKLLRAVLGISIVAAIALAQVSLRVNPITGLPDLIGSVTTAVTSVAGTANEITCTGSSSVTCGIASTFDISGKTSTSPAKVGTSLPASCTVGNLYVKTDASAANVLYVCTATNTWTAQGTTATGILILRKDYAAGFCVGGVGSLGLGSGVSTSLIPTPDCVVGTNVEYGIATFPDADGEYTLSGSFIIPALSAMNLGIGWRSAATSGNAVWQLQTACSTLGATLDPSWNTAQTVTSAAQGTTNRYNTATISSITLTGCTAGDRFFFRFFRDRTNGSDTISGAIDLIGLSFTQ